MYITQRDKVASILNTVAEAFEYMIGTQQAGLLEDCRVAVMGIIKFLTAIGGDIDPAEAIKRKIDSAIDEEQELLSGLKSIEKQIEAYKLMLKQIKCRYKAVFLPYKAEMWTSLESIWQAAAEDEYCDAVVIPIPYADIGKADKGRIDWHCENDRFPAYVPITNYQEYSLEKQEPEMIFIHNPYDDTNTLTRVLPAYYSSELKKYTKQLIYSPYFTVGTFTYGKHDYQYLTPAGLNADKIIVQSQYVKNIYMKRYHYPEHKLMALGSPKLDAVLNNKDMMEVPQKWKNKLGGKKVFLLNTHLSYFPQSRSLVSKYGFDYAVKHHKEILETFINKDNIALIWRPHPMMKMMVQDRFPECLEFINYFEKELQKSDNCVVDYYADYRMTFQCSDAMITTYSSLINEYLATGKPVLLFRAKPSDQVARQSPIDLRTCYYRYAKGEGMSFRRFAEMVVKGEDPKHEERLQMLRNKAFSNMDGSAGKKIFAALTEEIKQ